MEQYYPVKKSKMKYGYVYHIENPENPGIQDGYVGVVLASKGYKARFNEHRLSKSHMRSKIKNYNISVDNVKVLFYGEIQECYQKEQELRPNLKMGWNIDRGGRGYYYTSEIDNLSVHRSIIQSARMSNTEIKIRQSQSFKDNYYSSEESQKLRSLRAKEHMSDPTKKQKCLDAMHKLVQCPHCEYTNNAGNVKQHIKRKHNDI